MFITFKSGEWNKILTSAHRKKHDWNSALQEFQRLFLRMRWAPGCQGNQTVFITYWNSLLSFHAERISPDDAPHPAIQPSTWQSVFWFLREIKDSLPSQNVWSCFGKVTMQLWTSELKRCLFRCIVFWNPGRIFLHTHCPWTFWKFLKCDLSIWATFVRWVTRQNL